MVAPNKYFVKSSIRKKSSAATRIFKTKNTSWNSKLVEKFVEKRT